MAFDLALRGCIYGLCPFEIGGNDPRGLLTRGQRSLSWAWPVTGQAGAILLLSRASLSGMGHQQETSVLSHFPFLNEIYIADNNSPTLRPSVCRLACVDEHELDFCTVMKAVCLSQLESPRQQNSRECSESLLKV